MERGGSDEVLYENILDLGLPIWLEVIGRAEYMRQLSLR